VHCHHINPRRKEKDDSYNNLVIVHKHVHILIHATSATTICNYLQLIGEQNIDLQKLNKLRNAVGNNNITLDNVNAN